MNNENSTFAFLFDRAVKEMAEKEYFKQLQKETDQLADECEHSLSEYELDVVADYLDLIINQTNQEESYLYRKGMCDCVSLLKQLGVLA